MSRLIVIAGPRCSGKSTLIQSLGVAEERLLPAGQEPTRLALRRLEDAERSDVVRELSETSKFSLSEALELGDPSSRKCLRASGLISVQMQKRGTAFSPSTCISRRLQDLHIDRLILHCAILSRRRRLGAPGSHEANKKLDILGLFAETTFVTLWADPEVLRDRLKARLAKRLECLVLGQAPLLRGLRKAYRLSMLRRLGGNIPKLVQRYDQWLQFCDTHEPKAHWIVDNSGVPVLLPHSRWSELRDRVMDSWASGT